MRLERKRYSEHCRIESLYREYYRAVSDYVERWRNVQGEIGRRFPEEKARGKGKKGGKVGVADSELIKILKNKKTPPE